MKKIACWLLIFCVLLARPAWCKKIAVVLSRTLPPYLEVFKGIESEAGNGLVKFDMDGNLEKGTQMLAGINANEYDAIITVGSEAIKAAVQTSTAVPFIYTLVFEKPELDTKKAPGVLVQVPLSQQFQNIKKLFSSAAKIGVIYDPAFSNKAITQARIAAQENDFSLLPLTVGSQTEVAEALDKLKHMQIDLLWSVADPTVANPAVVQQLIQYSLNNKIPYIGLAQGHVKAGATAALSVDLFDIGAQTALLANKVIKSGASNEIQYPRKVTMCVNAKTRKTLGLEGTALPPGVLQLE